MNFTTKCYCVNASYREEKATKSAMAACLLHCHFGPSIFLSAVSNSFPSHNILSSTLVAQWLLIQFQTLQMNFRNSSNARTPDATAKQAMIQVLLI